MPNPEQASLHFPLTSLSIPSWIRLPGVSTAEKKSVKHFTLGLREGRQEGVERDQAHSVHPGVQSSLFSPGLIKIIHVCWLHAEEEPRRTVLRICTRDPAIRTEFLV